MLLICDEPNRSEPRLQRLFRILKDGSTAAGHPRPAGRSVHHAARHCQGAGTRRTDGARQEGEFAGRGGVGQPPKRLPTAGGLR